MPTRARARSENRAQSLRRKLSSSMAALRKSEIRSTLLAATATRQSRRQSLLCKHCAASARRRTLSGSRRLFVNRFRLGFGKEFLKTWIIPDWVPDGIDLQTRNRNDISGRDCEQPAKYFYRVLRVTSVRFDLG